MKIPDWILFSVSYKKMVVIQCFRKTEAVHPCIGYDNVPVQKVVLNEIELNHRYPKKIISGVHNMRSDIYKHFIDLSNSHAPNAQQRCMPDHIKENRNHGAKTYMQLSYRSNTFKTKRILMAKLR